MATMARKEKLPNKKGMVGIYYTEREEVRTALRMAAAQAGHGSLSRMIRTVTEDWYSKQFKKKIA